MNKTTSNMSSATTHMSTEYSSNLPNIVASASTNSTLQSFYTATPLSDISDSNENKSSSQQPVSKGISQSIANKQINQSNASQNIQSSVHKNSVQSIGKFEEYSVDMCVVADDILLVVFVTTVIFSGDEYLVVLPGTFDLCEEEVK
jgi:hypothetical protein